MIVMQNSQLEAKIIYTSLLKLKKKGSYNLFPPLIFQRYDKGKLKKKNYQRGK